WVPCSHPSILDPHGTPAPLDVSTQSPLPKSAPPLHKETEWLEGSATEKHASATILPVNIGWAPSTPVSKIAMVVPRPECPIDQTGLEPINDVSSSTVGGRASSRTINIICGSLRNALRIF